MEGNSTGSGPGGNFLGSDRRSAYYGGTALTGTGQAVALFELDGYNTTDVSNYFTNVGQSLNVPINNVLLLGASGSSDGDDTEQVIDIIDAASVAPGLSKVLVYIAPRSTFASGTSDVAIFNQMATDDVAKQISVSWGWTPADPTSDDPIFLELVAQGQNVFVASGDYGAWVSGDFVYPAEDANVTAVGGTELTTNGAGGSWVSEIAWGGSNTSCQAGTGSGGGISLDNIQIPNYQQLAGVITAFNYGSTTLRNAPDVAAEANCDNYYCANGTCGTGLGGTSLAAPTWAGYMALVNQQAAANGQAPSGIGSLNPLIYPLGLSSNYGSDFHDIIYGDNYNSASPNLYPAITDYDLVTGWGSPNGQGLINALAGGATGPTTDYTLANNEWCAQSNSVGEYCNATPVVPGAYQNWTWPATGGGWECDEAVCYDSFENASIPPQGTQAIISQNCGSNQGSAGNNTVCTSPTFTFPNTPVSATTPVTVYMSGLELSTGDLATGNYTGAQGGWVNLTISQGTITRTMGYDPYETFPYMCSYSYAANMYDCMTGGVPFDGPSGWGLWPEPVVTGGSCSTDPDPNYGTNCIADYTSFMGPYVDTAVVTGITNLNQIHVSASARYGNYYGGYIWAATDN